MFGPILRAMSRNKTGAVLVAFQIAIALAVTVNAVFIMQQRIAFMQRDSGLAIDNIIAVGSFGFASDYDHHATVNADLDLLRSLPGVRSATPSDSVPLSGSGSANGFESEPGDLGNEATANYYGIDEQGVETLGITLREGRGFRAEEIYRVALGEQHSSTQAIVTARFASQLFPDETSYLGKVFYDGADSPMEIIGVIEKMQGAWLGWDEVENVVLMPFIRGGPMVRYMLNVEEDQLETLIPMVEETLASSSSTRLINQVMSLREISDKSYSGDRGMAVALMVVIALLVTVTALGIVGLASFNVRQRTKQIGTRRAVGAKRSDILRYFLAENWLMTTAGVILGIVLTLLLNYYLASEYSLDLIDPVYLPVGVLTMWALGLLAVLGPARRASVISPAVATRTV
ncbi:MAG: ABC transporter permease [Gammaproteobacteria bacterium]